MDLRQLEYLVAIDDCGTFTAAAAKLHVAQPSLSHAIRRLEHELGVELFARLGRSVAPTEAGREVIDSARQVLRDMADVRAAAAAATTLVRGTLDLTALPTLAVDPLAGLIGRFRSEHEGVTIQVHEPETTAEVEATVRSGRAELGFTDITTGGRGLVRIALSRQDVVVVSPPGRADAATAVTPSMLASIPLVVTPVGTSTRRLLDMTLSRGGYEPDIAVEIGHREAIVALVLAGAGSSLLPRPLAIEAAARGAIVRELKPVLTRRVGILHRRGRLSPAALAMISMARS
ncbi:MAG TPA: LysR family transcriptional regulator [Acidimicrobiia bacterium]|nr:LysR family transcriptional regulator [Acidimicrobiia bacterium]